MTYVTIKTLHQMPLVGPAHTRGRADKPWGTGSPKRINPINWGRDPTILYAYGLRIND